MYVYLYISATYCQSLKSFFHFCVAVLHVLSLSKNEEDFNKYVAFRVLTRFFYCLTY